MPRAKKETTAEPKRRSRTGCWPCKARKVKCGEEKPSCLNCAKNNDTCDYSIRLNWSGRGGRREATPTDPSGFSSFSVNSPRPSAGGHSRNSSAATTTHEHVFSAQHIVAAPRPRSSHPIDLPTPPELPPSTNDAPTLDPRLRTAGRPPSRDFQAISYHPPPDRSPTSAPNGDEFRWSPQHSAKRIKTNPGSPNGGNAKPIFAMPQYPPSSDLSPGNYFTAHSISSIVNAPATPGSSINSGSPFPLPPHPVQDPPDLRRLSVKSLLSDPSELDRPRFSRSESSSYRTYGYDHGQGDLDTPRNDDLHVIHPRSPDLRRPSVAVSVASSSSGEPDAKQIAFEPGGYYAQPVPIRILKSLEPLPLELQTNPMNLLYFHHFINHTGRLLVPHDCPENPYRTVLPQMAVRNPQLLHLMLSYSASHRARLLGHEEPANRIAAWMEDVLPALRRALAEPVSPGTVPDSTDPSSLAPLATAIMLASLEIVSPKTLSGDTLSIPWHGYLEIARQIIIAKGGLDRLAQQADGARDKAIFFLSRWFAYLDVLGSISSGSQSRPLFGAYDEDGGGLWLVNRDEAEVNQIDCFFGFSGRFIALLARVAELAAQADTQRINPANKEVREDWRPVESVRIEAEGLVVKLRESVASADPETGACMHTNPNDVYTPGSAGSERAKTTNDSAEIYTTNSAYHWAALIHLYRRVLALPSSDPLIQECVTKIIADLSRVRNGSSAESNLLFPIFSAGCEALSEEDRKVLGDRLRGVEGWGMAQMERARWVMEEVWRTGWAWERFVEGEFFG